ncbi:MAG: HD domain-containing protein [Parcubacteria group bacterium]
MNIIEQVKEKAKIFFDNSGGGHHDWDHTLRVCSLCEKIGRQENADLEILKMAAFLHDIAREKEFESKGESDHAAIGAEMAEQILKDLGVEQTKINSIVHCIAAHRFRNNIAPESLEAKILFDSDKLDSIGAIGIGRAFLFAGAIGARLHNSDLNVEKTDSYSKEDTAYREYTVKLCKLKNKMLTNEGRRVAENRHNYMKEFFEKLDSEIAGID